MDIIFSGFGPIWGLTFPDDALWSWSRRWWKWKRKV